ncbi:MAG: hypothetical protein EOP24_26250 [Hyphomicrobiales bacterium]|nr:MAG: hypothetical protein EOP24_26250 [Hyphomicrobiales bacterium]
MKPKRVFQVYQEQTGTLEFTRLSDTRVQRIPTSQGGAWRFRVLAPRAPVARRIVGGSCESFHSRGNAIRAARREASLYLPGVAAVEIEGQVK